MIKVKSILVFFFCILFLSISCKKDNDLNPSDALENGYSGTLTVDFTNVLPPFDVSGEVSAEINKQTGEIIFGTTSLTYSGDTIIEDDSKYSRSGTWEINPVGTLSETDKDIIDFDGGITVVNDIQKLYVLNDIGEWELVQEIPINESPFSGFSFSINEAVTEGSKRGISTANGSIFMTLNLLVTLD